ncbi:hypothetical protein B0H19DRAFT_1072552 [Mycena capillaripes]|nr:hypothetical protein B0H19DRAFT_1072552 [Mycena capillaripes]
MDESTGGAVLLISGANLSGIQIQGGDLKDRRLNGMPFRPVKPLPTTYTGRGRAALDMRLGLSVGENGSSQQLFGQNLVNVSNAHRQPNLSLFVSETLLAATTAHTTSATTQRDWRAANDVRVKTGEAISDQRSPQARDWSVNTSRRTNGLWR